MKRSPAIEAAVRSFEDQIPFNKILGLRVDQVGPERVQVSFDKRPEHIGNFIRQTLHGGVISSVLDTTGGLIAFVRAAERLEGEPEELQRQTLARIGTIDLRVDYLEVAQGESFRAAGRIMRAGGRVAVTRMELYDVDTAALIAVGTGTYIIG
ncbi:MAG: thioesterase family protein [Thermoanaerobaculia bacterium]|nr:thioesterase family protein [Thermoanaerobaculia bacterium]